MKITICPLKEKYAPGVFPAARRASKFSQLLSESSQRAGLHACLPMFKVTDQADEIAHINSVLAKMESPVQLKTLEVNSFGVITAAIFE